MTGLYPRTAVVLSRGLKAHYHAASLHRLYQTTDTSTPVTTSGQPIGRLEDRSGNGRHLIQSTSGERPSYLVDVDGLPSIKADGSDDSLNCTTPEALGSSWSLYRVIRAYAMSGDRRLENWQNEVFAVGFSGMQLQVAVSFFQLSGLSVTAGQLALVTVISNGSAISVRLNRTSGTGLGSTVSLAGALGCNFFGKLSGFGATPEIELKEARNYNLGHSTDQRDTVERYLCDEWGIT
jgi:hypothetical protein